MIPSGLWIGLFGALGWITILTHAVMFPAARIWPPKQRAGSVAEAVIMIWSWGLTICIYVGLVRLGAEDGNVLGLPSGLRWIGGGALALIGSALHSWGTAALGLKATCGFCPDAAPCDTGPYRHIRHPQYLGQGLSFLGLALISGGDRVWIVASLGCLALIFAANRESAHLRTAPQAVG